MRFFSSSRWIALAMSSALVACGVFLDLGDDAAGVPDRVDAEADADPDGGGALDAALDTSPVDAPVDACAMPAACAPELVRNVGNRVTRLVVSGNDLYVATGLAGSRKVLRVANAPPGAMLDLDPQASGPDQASGDTDIAVDPSGAVYWGTPNGLRRHEAGAGADASTDAGVTALSELGAPVSAVRIAGGRLQYAVRGPNGGGPTGGHLASCAVPGCSDVQVHDLAVLPSDLVLIGTTHWWMGTDPTLTRFGLHSSGGAFGDVPSQQTPSHMVTDGQHIYWSTADNLRMFTPASPATPSDLLAASTDVTTRIDGIALEADGTLYVTQQSEVKRCTVVAGKCTFTPVATTAGTALDVATDATFLYWGTSDGSIYRLRKP